MERHVMRKDLFSRLLTALVCLGPAAVAATEQLEQETIVIKGNQQLPRTLYIAPWKRVGEPLGSAGLEGEIGEEAEPLERDQFLYELELQSRDPGGGDSSRSSPAPIQPPFRD